VKKLPVLGNPAPRCGAGIPDGLVPLVEQEAHRVLSEASIAPDPARIADGWERRFIADGARAEEMMELYRELGFEVVADPVRAEQMGDDCQDCQILIILNFKTIYTRRS
jgi:hypothetical protein